MDRPELKEHSYGSYFYNVKEYNEFFDSLNCVKEDVRGKKLYLLSKTISQSKIREAGFKIVRDLNKADIIVFGKIEIHKYNISDPKHPKHGMGYSSNSEIEKFFDEYSTINNGVFIKESDLYKYLYKYEGNQELFRNINDLLSSNNHDNEKIAMEFMSNANWTGNEIYLQELFARYWYNIRGNPYKNSISFSGFLSSLNFEYMNISLNYASNYRELCKNQEHHDWVYNKFKDEFKEDLDELISKHKIKIDKLEYSIDFSLNNKEND